MGRETSLERGPYANIRRKYENRTHLNSDSLWLSTGGRLEAEQPTNLQRRCRRFRPSVAQD